MAPNSPQAENDLIRHAHKLGLIDTWTIRDSQVILSKDSVTYRLSAASADRFLRALIRSSSPRALPDSL